MESYIFDDSITLARGMKDGDQAPDDYVAALQSDLAELGFSLGRCDGDFGGRTERAVTQFQTEAKQPERRLGGVALVADPVFAGEVTGKVDKATREEIHRWQEHGWTRAVRVDDAPPPWQPPAGVEPAQVHGFAFAPLATDAVVYWPVRTDNPTGRLVSFRASDGHDVGNAARRFCATRSEGQRHHAGVDLYGDPGDVLVACEAGVIVNHYYFYRTTHALFLQCNSGLVINYGEVAADSWKAFGVETGTAVVAGQPIARVGKMNQSSMCHFETYSSGKTNQRYLVSGPKPDRLLDPSRFLLDLAARGR